MFDLSVLIRNNICSSEQSKYLKSKNWFLIIFVLFGIILQFKLPFKFWWMIKWKNYFLLDNWINPTYVLIDSIVANLFCHVPTLHDILVIKCTKFVQPCNDWHICNCRRYILRLENMCFFCSTLFPPSLNLPLDTELKQCDSNCRNRAKKGVENR